MDELVLVESRGKLEKRKSEITAAYNRFRVESRDTSSNDGPHDFVDFAVDSYTKDFLHSLSSLELKQLHQIEEALAAIENEDYGFCRQCGNEISEKRLRAVPWARHCIKCQELEEQGLIPSYLFRKRDASDESEDEEEGEEE